MSVPDDERVEIKIDGLQFFAYSVPNLNEKDLKEYLHGICIVCKSMLKSGATVAKLQCSHFGHKSCVDEIRKDSKNRNTDPVCPICQAELRIIDEI